MPNSGVKDAESHDVPNLRRRILHNVRDPVGRVCADTLADAFKCMCRVTWDLRKNADVSAPISIDLGVRLFSRLHPLVLKIFAPTLFRFKGSLDTIL